MYYSQKIFSNNLIDSIQVMQSTWQTGVANVRLELSGESSILDFYTKVAVRKH